MRSCHAVQVVDSVSLVEQGLSFPTKRFYLRGGYLSGLEVEEE